MLFISYFHLNNSAFWSMVGLRELWEVQNILKVAWCSLLKQIFSTFEDNKPTMTKQCYLFFEGIENTVAL